MTVVLHVLSQRAEQTGSGITLDAFVRHAARNDWEQHVVCAVAAGEQPPAVGGLSRDCIAAVQFESESLPFPIVGMSDVMPYRSSVWSALSSAQLQQYRQHWRGQLQDVIVRTRPDVIHSHHVWLLSSMLKDIAPDVPVVTSCHATGLRQMKLCAEELGDEVRRGCARNDHFVALHRHHRDDLCDELGIEAPRVTVVGAGYGQEVFTMRSTRPEPGHLAYAGKFSRAKGLPELLDVMAKHPELTLHVAGGGTGDEAEAIAARMKAMPNVVLHGMLSQRELAALLRGCGLFVLPSFYEGLPLVLVEALASGCRLVATRLPGIDNQLAPALGDLLQMVEPPAMQGPDVPVPTALPAFCGRLEEAIVTALQQEAIETVAAETLRPFTWKAVFERVERVWRQAI